MKNHSNCKLKVQPQLLQHAFRFRFYCFWWN